MHAAVCDMKAMTSGDSCAAAWLPVMHCITGPSAPLMPAGLLLALAAAAATTRSRSSNSGGSSSSWCGHSCRRCHLQASQQQARRVTNPPWASSLEAASRTLQIQSAVVLQRHLPMQLQLLQLAWAASTPAAATASSSSSSSRWLCRCMQSR